MLKSLTKFYVALLLEKLSLIKVAFADDGDGDSSGSANQVNYEDLIAKARKEEKEKLYPQIKSLKELNKTLTEQHNSLLLENAKLKSDFENLQKAEEGRSEKWKKEIDDLKAQLSTLEDEKKNLIEQSKTQVETLRSEIEAEYEVKLYIQEKLTENQGKILSSFTKLVAGKTKEEVDESIKKAIEDTENIKKELGISVEGEDNKNAEPEKGDVVDIPANSNFNTQVNKQNLPAGTNVNANVTESIDMNYLASLDPASDEYKEFRKKLGLK